MHLGGETFILPTSSIILHSYFKFCVTKSYWLDEVIPVTKLSLFYWESPPCVYSANEEYSFRRLGRIRPTIHHNGNVTLDCPVLLYTVCRIDVADYPLDRQKCNLVFGSWSHHSGEIKVTSQVTNLHSNLALRMHILIR